MNNESVFSLLAFGDTGWGDDLLAGAWITVQLAAVSLVCGLALGLLLAGGRLSPWRPLNWLTNTYIIFIRGTPEFLVLLLVFFGLDLVVQQIAAGLGIQSSFEVPKFAAAVAGLSLIFSAYASEVFRGAYLAVPTGQIEAATATGMSAGQVFWRVRLPQMWRFALPGLANLWMVLLKDTSLAAVIALDELLRQAKVASESTLQPLVFYLAAGAIYLVLTAVSDIARHRLELGARRGYAR
ncbi:ABC transporter permease subunit [Devosia rhodophyticola]|uniref:ABC transporter permease subunit n=1 Tax=Devosia rhodophyticola TaxID=3026423 RepID=A0ABY7YTY1_9HYPH|nr:ABC transporter permease subunit [Devosia rhodophyticola]WDR04495.1 ABC transporter permease subunit [Devosia rhodophyticola]